MFHFDRTSKSSKSKFRKQTFLLLHVLYQKEYTQYHRSLFTIINFRVEVGSIFCDIFIPAYARDPPKNDISVYRSAATENLSGQRYHVMPHHKKAYETAAIAGRNGVGDDKMDHRKTQHFVRGKVEEN